jgi:hypothetical protein
MNYPNQTRPLTPEVVHVTTNPQLPLEAEGQAVTGPVAPSAASQKGGRY